MAIIDSFIETQKFYEKDEMSGGTSRFTCRKTRQSSKKNRKQVLHSFQIGIHTNILYIYVHDNDKTICCTFSSYVHRFAFSHCMMKSLFCDG